MKKISLILPVYNVEQYLPKCIESCLCQDLSETEYEIIIVIDGSLDNSLSIAKKYQQKYLPAGAFGCVIDQYQPAQPPPDPIQRDELSKTEGFYQVCASAGAVGYRHEYGANQ